MKCGAPLPDGAKFCAKCGSKTALDEAPKAESPGTAAGTMPQTGTDINAGTGSSTPAVKPPKKKKGGIIAASVAGVAVVTAGVTVALNWKSLQNTISGAFSSPKEYYQQVESGSIKALSSSIAKSYDSVVNPSTQKKDIMGLSSEITLKLDSKEILSVLEDETGMDMSWLREISISGENYIKDNLTEGSAGIRLNGTDIFSADVIYDIDNSKIFLQIPELSDKYVSMDLSDYIDYYAYGMTPSTDELTEVLQAVSEILPDASQVEALTEKYLKLVLSECLDDVEKEKNVTLKVEDVKQDCTRLTVTIDADTIKNIVKTVSKELAKDKEVKKVIINLLDGLSNNAEIRNFCNSETAELLEDIFDIDISSLPYLLNMLDSEEVYNIFQAGCQEISENADDLFDSDVSGTIKFALYVDKKGEVIGREINADDGIFVLECFNPRSGSDVGYQIALSSEGQKLFVLSGTGKESKDKLNGEFTLKVAGIELLSIEAKDFDTKTLQQGLLNGSFTITPSSQLNAEINDNLAWLWDYGPKKNLAIAFDSSMSTDEIKWTLGLKEGNSDMASISYAAKQTSGKKGAITLPSNSLSLYNTDSLETYWNSIKWEEFAQTLDKAGLPSQLTTEIKLLKALSFNDLSRILYYLY